MSVDLRGEGENKLTEIVVRLSMVVCRRVVLEGSGKSSDYIRTPTDQTESFPISGHHDVQRSLEQRAYQVVRKHPELRATLCGAGVIREADNGNGVRAGGL